MVRVVGLEPTRDFSQQIFGAQDEIRTHVNDALFTPRSCSATKLLEQVCSVCHSATPAYLIFIQSRLRQEIRTLLNFYKNQKFVIQLKLLCEPFVAREVGFEPTYHTSEVRFLQF